jgi:hypothetical protein
MIATATSQEMLARPQIVRVSSKGKSHRGRNALIGLGIGAGGGLIAGVVVDHESCANRTNCLDILGPNVGKEVLTPVGALIGAIVGAVIPTGGWRDLYRAK